jgi:ribosomal protein S1
MIRTLEPEIDIFDDITSLIKVRKGEKILSREPYAAELYNLMLGYDTYDSSTNTLAEGDVVEGRIVQMTELYLAVDIRSKDYLYIDMRSDESLAIRESGKTIGDKISVLVTHFKTDPYDARGSFTKYLRQVVEVKMKEDSDTETMFKCYIKELTPAGYLVDIVREGLKFAAFMPNTLAGVNKLHDPQSLVGTTMDIMLDGYSYEKKTFIASRKKYLETLIPSTIKKMDITDAEGNYLPYEGVVTGVSDFGVFVEVYGCVTGLIHKSNIEPELKIDTIQPGKIIAFYIKEKLAKKLILTRVIRETIWDTIRGGRIYDGIVKDIKSFGALIRLDEETIGLIHNLEMVKGGFTLKAGDTARVKVLSVNREDRKIFLTMAPKKTSKPAK